LFAGEIKPGFGKLTGLGMELIVTIITNRISVFRKLSPFWVQGFGRFFMKAYSPLAANNTSEAVGFPYRVVFVRD
jgi:hypothetical protein